MVGPLTKKGYIANLKQLAVYDAIPDISANAWGFNIDPLDPNRVRATPSAAFPACFASCIWRSLDLWQSRALREHALAHNRRPLDPSGGSTGCARAHSARAQTCLSAQRGAHAAGCARARLDRTMAQ